MVSLVRKLSYTGVNWEFEEHLACLRVGVGFLSKGLTVMERAAFLKAMGNVYAEVCRDRPSFIGGSIHPASIASAPEMASIEVSMPDGGSGAGER